ncbi:hypothetical protein D9758_012788 [Tetrapyrgos nigripes]|uniref:Uncharacterized protein n=1 Tax=Tetrapyrgos nigripes TaxID=182062 RepID=A0A8H5D079_9AGAR|nr:hypothetical protein D9758_012788 [Tetrapyrgos nigripes]
MSSSPGDVYTTRQLHEEMTKDNRDNDEGQTAKRTRILPLLLPPFSTIHCSVVLMPSVSSTSTLLTTLLVYELQTVHCECQSVSRPSPEAAASSVDVSVDKAIGVTVGTR